MDINKDGYVGYTEFIASGFKRMNISSQKKIDRFINFFYKNENENLKIKEI